MATGRRPGPRLQWKGPGRPAPDGSSGCSSHDGEGSCRTSRPKEKQQMFERFTDRARRVVVLAQEEARMLNHNYIGTEHILLGLIHEGEGVAAKALESLGHLAGGRPPAGRGDHRPGPAGPVRAHPLHPAGQEGAGAVAARGAAARPQLHRHRAHPARPDPRGRGRRRPGPGQARAPTSTGSASRSSSCSPATRARSRPRPAARRGHAVDLAGARPVRPQPHPGRPRVASSTRSSGGRRRSSGSCRCCPAGPRTTRS